MSGEIKIPFAFDLAQDLSVTPQIKVEHLVFNKFENAEFKKFELPDKNFGTKENYVACLFQMDDSTTIKSDLRFNQILKTDALKYWFTDLNYDKQNHVLSGYLHYAISVQDLYATKITFSTVYEN